MAKKRSSDDEIPTLGADETNGPINETNQLPTVPPGPKSETLPSVSLDVPMGSIPLHVYSQRHLDFQLTTAQGITLKRLYFGLDRDGKRMANGQRVQSSADAVRWLLDQLETPVEEEIRGRK